MELQELSKSGFVKEFQQAIGGRHPRKFCFVLGAGASVSSNIRSGQRLVWVWDAELRDRYGEAYLKWKAEEQIEDAHLAEHYSKLYEKRFPIPVDGYDFMEGEMEKASPSAGYAALAYLLCKQELGCNIVLTTNFDRLAEDVVNRQQHMFPLVIGHEALAHYIVADAKRPIVIKIHRDLLMDPKSRTKEIDKLDERWRTHLETVFSNYHPVFIGYAGNDNSLMDYLIENSKKVQSGAWKLPYWTLYEKDTLQGKAKRFMEAAGGYVIRDCDFDALMIRLADAAGYRLGPVEDYIRGAQEEHRRIKEKIEAVLKPEQETRGSSGTSEEASPQGAGGDGQKKPKATADAAREAQEAQEAEHLSGAIGRIVGDEDAESRDARYRQAVLARNRGDYGKAEGLLRQLTAEEPENAKYRYSYGVTLHMMKRYEEARAEKQRAVELEPENAYYHNQLGVTLSMMERYEEARVELQLAVDLEPENAFYRNELGITLQKMKRYEEARAEHQRAVELEPGNAFYRNELGITLQKMKRYEEAQAETEQAIALEPDNPKYYWSLGWLYTAWGKPVKAWLAKNKAEALETGGN